VNTGLLQVLLFELSN